MRSLIVRFFDSEGPGILEPILREKGYQITYHDAYKKGLQLMPKAHLVFDRIILLGGPQSVYDPELEDFFEPYLELVENAISQPDKKVIGVCLGSQIIAKALGGEVFPGEKGPETGFGYANVLKPNQGVFEGISEISIPTFHLHGDTFTIPNGAELLLSSEMYPNQMFSYKNKIYAIQCHFEPTIPMLKVWEKIQAEFLKKGQGMGGNIEEQQPTMERFAKILFQNILR